MELFLMDAAPGPCNVMLDLETWGLTPGCAIRSIGAVLFDPHTDEVGETFYSTVSDQSCRDAGLTFSEESIAWWSRQKRDAQDALLVDQRHIREVALAFHDWFHKQRGVFVWSQGANFDEPLWTAVARALGLKVPWKYVDTRCTRTAYDMGGFNPRSIKRIGTHHNALDDATHQAQCVQAAYRQRRENRT